MFTQDYHYSNAICQKIWVYAKNYIYFHMYQFVQLVHKSLGYVMGSSILKTTLVNGTLPKRLHWWKNGKFPAGTRKQFLSQEIIISSCSNNQTRLLYKWHRLQAKSYCRKSSRMTLHEFIYFGKRSAHDCEIIFLENDCFVLISWLQKENTNWYCFGRLLIFIVSVVLVHLLDFKLNILNVKFMSSATNDPKCISSWFEGGGKGTMPPSSPSQQPKIVLEMTILSKIQNSRTPRPKILDLLLFSGIVFFATWNIVIYYCSYN